MPDGIVLQGTFCASEKIQDIKDFVQQCLIDRDMPFKLSDRSPQGQLDDFNQTMQDNEKDPVYLLYLKWEEDDGVCKQGVDIAKLRGHIFEV